MKASRNLVILLTLVFFVSTSSFVVQDKIPSFSRKTKNIILFIGDGMGVAHLTAGMTVNGNTLNMMKFPYSGFSITQSADNYITDSAAGGTAIACGVKTNNGMIGVTPDNTSVASITEIVHSKGLSTGIVSTSAVTHATPASFVAHNSSRGNYEDIALHYLNGSVDVFMGGGEDHFRKRADGRDLADELEKQGFDLVYNIDELRATQSPRIAALLSRSHMPTVGEGRSGSLEEMTKKAIEVLSRDKDGFFLIIEGSMIDWGAHDNDLEYVISETIDMDKAIGVAMDFANSNRKTLIVVTADHETGGLVLTDGDTEAMKVSAVFGTTDHSGTMVPVLSYGPGAQKFSGIRDNTYFFDAFLNLLRIRK